MIIRVFALLAVLCFSGAAQAVQISWSIPGSGCVPSDATTKFNRHLVVNGTVQHAAGNVGLIELICPITQFTTDTTSWNLFLGYRDSTATGASAFVRARLYAMPIAGGPPVPLAMANSNSSASTAAGYVASPVFPHTFNFSLNSYWVRVELARSSTSQTVIFRSLLLELP
jgi:hypothetical protein